ncbi:MAG TPA: class I SAM-dependent methyltransferase [bacterium]
MSALAPPAPSAAAVDRALLRRVLFWMDQPPRRVVASAWNGHLGFANALVALARPARIVELGVHVGGSFIAFCDACVRHDVAAEVIGVDTWLGDPHLGKRDSEAVYEGLCALAAREWPFARLVRADFDTARTDVADGSVDLLHIDGYHTLEAVANDFNRWHSALSPHGICLFHDIAVHERNFGVHQLWAELRGRWPSIEFHHSSGLGVLFVGAEQPDEVRALLSLWHGSPLAREALRTAAEVLSASFPARTDEERQRVRELEETAGALRREVCRLEPAAAHLENVTSSRIWRWSAPLRALLDRLAGGR